MSDAQFPLYLIPLAPLVGAAINLTIGRRLARETVHLVACGAIAVAAILALHAVFGPLRELWSAWDAAGRAGTAPALRDHVFTWMQAGALRIDLAFLLDPLSAVMIVTITFVGFLIHLYSTGYMAHDPRYAAYFGYLNLFSGAMLILVLGDSLPVLFIGWEGVGLCSFLLIGFWFDKEKNANAGRKAFVVNRVGDFGFLLGIFLLYWATRSLDFAGLQASVARLQQPLFEGGSLSVAFFAGLLLFVGATGKSAQLPLYVWLPDAMAGPTPVSALIHAATMVTAGVYMIARLGFLYLAAPTVMMIVAGVGAATALFAAIIGFAQTDIKKVLAYSTVSQLGFMFVGVGTGAFAAGVFHLFTHAFFKAGLFLGAGSVMHAMGDRTEIMEMGGLRKKLPFTHGTFLVYCLAIAGIVPFAGFFSKDAILAGAFAAHLDGWPAWYGKLLWIVLSASALGTAFYMWRLYFLVFSGECRADAETRAHIHESPAVMTGPLVVLAVGAALLGFLGLPHVFFGAPNVFAEWLAPVLAGAPELHLAAPTEWGLMALALGLGAFGILFAWYLYKDGPGERVRRLVAPLAPIYKVVSHKFYVDELYELIVVRPFRWIATALYTVVDRFVIDLVFVNGSAFAVWLGARLVRFWQNGDVQRYLAAMLAGTAAIVWLTSRPVEYGFESHKTAGLLMEFVADVGSGPEAQGLAVEWDFDGDGQSDAKGRRVRWTFPSVGAHTVSMKVKDEATGETVSRLSRTVEVEGSK